MFACVRARAMKGRVYTAHSRVLREETNRNSKRTPNLLRNSADCVKPPRTARIPRVCRRLGSVWVGKERCGTARAAGSRPLRHLKARWHCFDSHIHHGGLRRFSPEFPGKLTSPVSSSVHKKVSRPRWKGARESPRDLMTSRSA